VAHFMLYCPSLTPCIAPMLVFWSLPSPTTKNFQKTGGSGRKTNGRNTEERTEALMLYTSRCMNTSQKSCIYIYIYVCVYVYRGPHMCMYIYIYIYVLVKNTRPFCLAYSPFGESMFSGFAFLRWNIPALSVRCVLPAGNPFVYCFLMWKMVAMPAWCILPALNPFFMVLTFCGSRSPKTQRSRHSPSPLPPPP